MKGILALATMALLMLGGVREIASHGKMMWPPNRSSIWRHPQFANQNPPSNYDDNQLYCGAIHQADDPGTNCGVCGDPASQSSPRDNEIGGRFYKGIIVGDYTSGQTIDIEVDLNAAHLGNMEWRLCTNTLLDNQQSCYDQHVLRLESGGTKLPVVNPGIYRTRAILPAGVRASHAILQWNYRGGNQYGDCGDGTQGLGCGPQETFRGCADIRIS